MTPFETNHISTSLGIDGTDCKPALIFLRQSLFHLPHDDQRTTLKLLATFVSQNGLLIFTTGPEYDEVWSDNGGHDLYHASLSSEEYEQILTDSDFKVLTHKIRDPECVWVAQKN